MWRAVLTKLMACVLSDDEVISRLQQQTTEAKKLYHDAKRLKDQAGKLQEDYSRDLDTPDDIKSYKNAKNKASSSAPDCFLTKAEIASIADEDLQDKVVRMLKYFDEKSAEASARHREEVTRLQHELDHKIEQHEAELRMVESEKDDVISSLRRDVSTLQDEVARKNSIMVNLTQTVSELQTDLRLVTQQHAACQPTITDLHESITQLHTQLQIAHTPKVPDLSLVIPLPCSTDDRLHKVLTQLVSRLERQHGVHIHTETRHVSGDADAMVTVPCIVSTSINSDLKAALKKAQLGDTLPDVIIMLHHLAPHNCRVRTPSRKRLSTTTAVRHARLVTDAVFWHGQLYDCDINAAMVHEICQLART